MKSKVDLFACPDCAHIFSDGPSTPCSGCGVRLSVKELVPIWPHLIRLSVYGIGIGSLGVGIYVPFFSTFRNTDLMLWVIWFFLFCAGIGACSFEVLRTKHTGFVKSLVACAYATCVAALWIVPCH